MAKLEFFSEEFDAAVVSAGARARKETLEAGVPVFYRDSVSGLELMEYPDGRKFEIRFVPNAPREHNYEVLREISRSAA
jgi:hypothetical protein